MQNLSSLISQGKKALVFGMEREVHIGKEGKRAVTELHRGGREDPGGVCAEHRLFTKSFQPNSLPLTSIGKPYCHHLSGMCESK